MNQIKTQKLSALQGLRALATIGIFLFHSGFLLQGRFPVTLFFMLSGFMLYYTKHGLIQYPTYRKWISKYVKRKLTEFYPLHFMTFIIAIFVGQVIQKGITIETIKSGTLNLLLIQTFFPDYALSFNGLSWFLSVTMFLYGIGYFLIKIADSSVCNDNEKKWISIIITVIIALNTSNRFTESLYLYTNPIYRILDFFLGVLIAKSYLKTSFVIKSANKCELLIVSSFIFMYIISLFVKEDPGYYSILFTIALYVFAQGKGIISKILNHKAFETIAFYSFEFYMFHELALRFFRGVFTNYNAFYPIKLAVIALPALLISVILSVAYKYFRTKLHKN